MVGKHYCELLKLKMKICNKTIIFFPLVQKTGQRFLLSSAHSLSFSLHKGYYVLLNDQALNNCII